MSIELENKWAMAVKENADLRQQLAEAKQENEHLLDGNTKLLSDNIDLSNELAAQAAEIAKLRERLAAAEDMILHAKEGYFACIPLRRPSFKRIGDKWYAYWPGATSLLDSECRPIAFNDWYEAYQAAIAAGWIPPTAKGDSP